MFKIAFKGGLEDIILSNEDGEEIMDALKGGQKGLLDIGGKFIDAASIKAIIPSSEDWNEKVSDPAQMDALEAELKRFPDNERIDGFYASPFDRFLISKHVRGVRDGNLVCFDPAEDDHWSKIHRDLTRRQDWKYEQRMKTDPEFRRENQERLAATFARIRGFNKSKQMNYEEKV